MATIKSQGQRYKHAGHLSWRKVKSEAVILDLETSAYFSLNEVGVLIWEKIGQDQAPEQILDALCREYDVDARSAQEDIDTLIRQLLKQKLIVPQSI